MFERSRPVPPEIPGATFVRFLGAGGFADVFLYHQESPSRDVAVKVIRAEAGAEAQRRFKHETDTMALFSSHPSVVSVFDAGQTKDGRGYIVMEFCPPPNISQLCRHEPPSLDRVLKYAINIGSAVETIHRSGYLHRDIKPANILLTPFKRPVLTDFGIAVPIEAQVVDDEFGGASLPWAPYEQQVGNTALTPAADVYALGATVYNLLTRHAPHVDPAKESQNERSDMLRRAQTGDIPPITRADVPEQLRRVLRTALAPRPGDRYQTALGLVRDLQKIQRDQKLAVTEADIMEQSLAPAGQPGESDHTVLRPVTSIDPYQGTQDSLVADATRFKPRIIIPLVETDERTSADTLRGRPPLPAGQGLPAAGPLFSGVPAPGAESTGAQQASGLRHSTTAAPLPGPEPAPAAPAAAPLDSGGVPPEHRTAPPPSRRSVLGLTAAAVLVVAVAGIAVWSVLREEGGTHEIRPTASAEADVVGPGGEVARDAGVTNLRLAAVGKQVTVTWDYDGPEGTTFLYSVMDPVAEQKVQETSARSVTVDALPGRTCVQVVARSATGSSSVPATACQETP